MGVQNVQNDSQKNSFSSEVAKFAEKNGIDLTIIYRINDFFMSDS